MNDEKENTESFNEVKIIKPKVVRKCKTRKIKKSPSSSSSSSSNSSNSEKNQNHFCLNKPKNTSTNLDKISIEEINNDFFNFRESLEEELCQNELLDILNNERDADNKIIHKIKRCKKPYEKNIEFMKDSYFTDLINEFNALYTSQME